MKKTYADALIERRSFYALSKQTPVSDDKIEEIIHTVVKHVPSAFNSQSTRIILLQGEHHDRFWNIVKEALKEISQAEKYPATEEKINKCFLSGYSTVLFYEDQSVVKDLQNKFPLYKDNFPVWSEHTSAMHQFAMWCMLEDCGFGASLQHYNPLIDEKVAKEWNIPEDWKLIAQMPFGIPLDTPNEKEFQSVEDRIRIFR